MSFLRFLSVLLLMLWVEVAPAQSNREEAQRFYKKADTAYKLGDYQEALEGFQRSYELSEEPSILFNIGQCHRQLNRPSDAKKAFQFFVQALPDHPKRKSAEALIKELEAELSRLATKGAIEISSKQDPAEIFLNGASRGMSPKLLEGIEPGDYQVVLKKQGFSDTEITISVSPSETATLKGLQLVPLGDTLNTASKVLLWGAAGFGAVGALSAGTSVGIFFSNNKRQDDGLLPDVNNNSFVDQEDFNDESDLLKRRDDVASSFFLASTLFLSTAALSATSAIIIKTKFSSQKERR